MSILDKKDKTMILCQNIKTTCSAYKNGLCTMTNADCVFQYKIVKNEKNTELFETIGIITTVGVVTFTGRF